MALRIILTTGGTGGHIFPALAVAEALRRKRPDAEILFIGGLYGPEKELAEKARELFLLMDEQMFANVPEEECERILGMMETVQENLEKAIQGGTHEKTV